MDPFSLLSPEMEVDERPPLTPSCSIASWMSVMVSFMCVDDSPLVRTEADEPEGGSWRGAVRGGEERWISGAAGVEVVDADSSSGGGRG